KQVVEELHVELVILNDHDSLGHRFFSAPIRRWRRFASPLDSATIESLTKHQMRPTLPRSEPVEPSAAPLADACLGYLAENPDELLAFMQYAGLDPDALRRSVGSPSLQ